MAQTNTNQKVLSGALAENILTLLCFNTEAAALIVNSVDVGLFESDIYKDFAKKASDYFRSFHTAPGEHLSDLLENVLNDKSNTRKAALYEKTLINLIEFKDNINVKYVLSQLNNFVRLQKLKAGIIDATTHVKEGRLDQAENALNKSLKSTINIFQPGISLTNTKDALSFFNDITPAYMTGIAPLDKMGFGPTPGELLVILAAPNRGKTFFLIHLGKWAAIQRLKVAHISLEMSEEKTSQRYIQNIFSYSKHKADAHYLKFQHDEMGRFINMEMANLTRPSLADKNAELQLTHKLDKLQNRFKLWIKRFPTNGLTIAGLEAYLDAMDKFHHFMPDVLMVDYADLMKLDSSNLRTDTGTLYKELRRIAVERNVALVTASQSNRLGEDAKVINLKHLAEDYSKAATADNIIAYCQTNQEQKHGLARLFIAKARDEERAQSVLISQCYRIGQFHMGATHMDNRYWKQLDILANRENSIEGQCTAEESPKKGNSKTFRRKIKKQ